MSPGEDGLIGIPFPEHSSELLSHLNDQRRAGLLCDLTLTSRGARYPTHRSVMAAVSLYFRQLFGSEEGGGGGGAGGGGFSVCQLDCVAPDALDALLEFAYTATLTIPSSGMRDVLQGAQLLGIQCVADACRDILGETVEAEPPEEPRAQPAAADKAVPAARVAVTPSRRKTNRKKIKSIRPAHASPPGLNPPPPPSPILQSSPASDSFRSLPSTQPPSPEEPRHDPRLNGDPRALAEALGGPAMNGGFLHWYDERPAAADRLSEDDEVEGFADDGALMGDASLAFAGQEEAAAAAEAVAAEMAAEMAAASGRKRKSQTPQQCPVCQKIIHGAGKLPRHMRTHTGEKPFQCSTCGVRFTRNDKLKIHMRKHTGERPYICPHCPARFLHSYDLKNHLSLHSGARPFECPLCHKAFAREDHLQRHRKGHSCLEMRTRRPRQGPDRWDGGGGEGGEQPNPLEAFALQAHPSAYLAAAAAAAAAEGGMAAAPPLVFPGDSERGRALALQALAQLGPHRLAGYPDIILRSLDLRMGREAELEDPGRRRSPASHRDLWPGETKEENGETEAREEE